MTSSSVIASRYSSYMYRSIQCMRSARVWSVYVLGPLVGPLDRERHRPTSVVISLCSSKLRWHVQHVLYVTPLSLIDDDIYSSARMCRKSTSVIVTAITRFARS